MHGPWDSQNLMEELSCSLQMQICIVSQGQMRPNLQEDTRCICVTSFEKNGFELKALFLL